MTIHNVSAYDIRRVIASINRDYDTSMVAEKVVEWRTSTKHLRVRLILRLEDSSDNFHRRGQVLHRRMRNVCWHGGMLFWKRLFDLNPSAKVKTSVCYYADREDFQNKIPVVGGQYIAHCDCAGTEDDESLADDVYREILARTIDRCGYGTCGNWKVNGKDTDNNE